MSDLENGYTFRMGDHEITMRDSFSCMYAERQLTDCILVCPNLNNDPHDQNDNQLTNGHSAKKTRAQSSNSSKARVIKAHRVILSASSDYLRAIFESINQLNNNMVVIIINHVDFDDLDSIVDFVYKGQVSVSHTRIHKFLSAAQSLSIKGLMNIKLVSGDNNMPIEDNTNAAFDLEINRLKSEKRLLENQLKELKDEEKQKMDRWRKQIEDEFNKKLESERRSLQEAKKKNDAERERLNQEREDLEARRVQNNVSSKNNTAQEACTESPIKETQVNHIQVTSNEARTSNESQTESRGSSPTKSVSSTLRSGHISPQKPATNSTPVQKVLNSSEPESEGRQLRKRTRTSNQSDEEVINETQTQSKNQKVELLSKIDEDDDGEIYEVDFSSGQQPDAKTIENNVGEARQRFSAALGGSTSSTSTRAIVASTLASFSQTTPSAVSARVLRRSTSSHGSASTQSNTGENGFEAVPEAEPSSALKRRPGRPPSWMSEGLNQPPALPQPETHPTPTRKTLPSRRGRKPHKPLSLSTTSALYQCPYCPQVYHGHQAMQDHIHGIHLNSGHKYMCDFCGKVYSWRISLNKHMNTAHPQQEPVKDSAS